MEDSERLAKVIAKRGSVSRREAERLVAEGRVRVNGQIERHPGRPVNPEVDRIKVNGNKLGEVPRRVYLLLNKPKGTITSRKDPEGRASVLDLIPHLDVRVEAVGRLDMDTEGALLLTNDGVLANKLTHPSTQVPKRYVAKIYRTPTDKTLNRIRAGIRLDDGKTAPCKARIIETTDRGHAWIEVTVTEGRNRLIRRMFAEVGHPVSKLRRESFATISCQSLPKGESRPLSGDEVQRIRDIANGVPPGRAGHDKKYKEGFAKPKPKRNRPLSRKKATRRGARKNRGMTKR